MSDVFREVSEDLRREQLKQLWKRFGKYVIGAAVLIVVVVAGYQIVQSIQQGQKQDSGDRYQAALDLYRAGDLDGAADGFLAVTEDGYGGYPTLAMMTLANIRSEQGDIAGAVEAFDAVAADEGAAIELRNSAKFRAAYLLIDTAPFAEIQNRLGEFDETGNPYRILALEGMALSAIAAEDYVQAAQYVVQMAQDPFANEQTMSRVSVLYTIVNAHLPAAAGGEAAPGAAAEGAGAAPGGFAAGASGAAAEGASGVVPAGFAAEANPFDPAAETTAPTELTAPVFTTTTPGGNTLVPLLPTDPTLPGN